MIELKKVNKAFGEKDKTVIYQNDFNINKKTLTARMIRAGIVKK